MCVAKCTHEKRANIGLEKHSLRIRIYIGLKGRVGGGRVGNHIQIHVDIHVYIYIYVCRHIVIDTM